MKCNVKNPDTVLITGASSGIGEALAVECARRGVRNIFFCGRDAERVAAVVRKCEKASAKRLDGADLAARHRYLNSIGISESAIVDLKYYDYARSKYLALGMKDTMP